MKTLLAASFAVSTAFAGQIATAAGHSSTFVFDRVGTVEGAAAAIVGYSDETSTLYVAMADGGLINAVDLSDPANPAAQAQGITLSQDSFANTAVAMGAHQGHPMIFASSATDAGFVVYEASNPENLAMLADPTAADTGPALDIEYIPAAVSPGEQPLIAVVAGDGDIVIYQLNQ